MSTVAHIAMSPNKSLYCVFTQSILCDVQGKRPAMPFRLQCGGLPQDISLSRQSTATEQHMHQPALSQSQDAGLSKETIADRASNGQESIARNVQTGQLDTACVFLLHISESDRVLCRVRGLPCSVICSAVAASGCLTLKAKHRHRGAPVPAEHAR